MNQTRRTILHTGMAAGSLVVAVSAGLLTPRAVFAAWPKTAFNEKNLDKAINSIVGVKPSDSNKITVSAPDIAENGAVVSITVKTSLSNVESISVFVPENVSPLCSSYVLSQQTDGSITSRIKMRKTSDVIAVVKADGKAHTARKTVKVTLGGCGG